MLDAQNRVRFALGPYDHTKPLVIDPVLSYSTYLGGIGGGTGRGIAVDSAGNAYIAGDGGGGFPTVNPLQSSIGCGEAAFVVKLNPAGDALAYSTYLAGSACYTSPGVLSSTSGLGIAVDGAGNAYVTGWTNATDFPTVNPLQATNKGAPDESGFVAKLNPAGSALVYSTYLGGSSGLDEGDGIAVDSAGNAYVTGRTASKDFPTVNPLQATDNAYLYQTAFVAKLNPAGSALVYSTYLGGSGGEQAYGIAVDSAGNAYVTGLTSSTDFPTVNPLQSSLNGVADAFVAKLNPAGSALVYSTYLGGSGGDSGYAIAADSSGNAYVTGQTDSDDFPTVNALEPSSVGGGAFVAKLNPEGSAFIYSTYLGGGGDQGWGIAADGAGNAYVTGSTGCSTDFPTVNPLQSSPGGGGDAFVAKLNPTGSVFVYSACLGGSQADEGYGIAVDAVGNAYVTGLTSSPNFPTVNAFESTCESCCTTLGCISIGEAFVAKIGAVTFSPISLSFSNQMEGTTSPPQTVTLSNIGNANLTISNIAITGSVTGDFAIAATGTTCSTSTPVAVGTSCTVEVTFTPTIVGAESANLSVSDNIAAVPQPVPLSGTGVLVTAPNVSPTRLSFNGQLVGTTSASQPVTVTNTGTHALDITSLAISSGWTESNNCASVAASASCTINVSFQPTAGGPQTGTLTLTDNAVGSPQTVSLSGTGLVPAVSLSTSNLSFAAQTVSTSSSPQTLTLTNTGTGALTPLTITISGDFAQTNNCGGSVAAGASCTISVTFTPTGGGSRTGALTLTDNAANSPQTVSLSGTGLPPVVSLSTTSLSFAGQAVSTSSSPQTLLLTNTGTGTLTPLNVTISGDFAQTNNCTSSVAAGGGCTISVTFTPTAPGNRTGALTLTDNASNSPQTVALSGTGLGPTTSLSASSLTLPNQLVGTTSSAQPVTLQNTGNQALSISSISLTGANSADFAQTNNCTSSVAAAGGCTISVTFTPAAGGNRTGALTLTDNAHNSPQSVQLSGTGMDFQISSATTSQTVAAGQTATYSLTLAPQGGFNQTVSLACNGAPSLSNCAVTPGSVTLNGTASAAVTVQVTTTAGSLAPPSRKVSPPYLMGLGRMFWLCAFLALAGLGALVAAGKRRAAYLLGAGLLMVMLWSACGGGAQPTPGTPAGTYTLDVSAKLTNTTLEHDLKLSLTVD